MKKSLLVVLLLTAVAVVFAGGKKEAATSSEAKQVVVTWLNHGTSQVNQDYQKEIIAAFEAENPGVKIEQTTLENESEKSKIATMIQSGTPYDVFSTWGGGTHAEYFKAGQLLDITKYVDGTEFGNSIGAGTWAPYVVDGKYTGVPYNAGCVTFWYNKSLLKQVGYDTFPTDYDDFLVLVGKLKAAGITPISIGAGDKWPAMHFFAYLALRLGGGDVYANLANGKGFEDPAFIKAGEMMVDLVKMGAFQDGFLGTSHDDMQALLGNGQAAMELGGQWSADSQKNGSVSGKGLGDDLGCAAFPAIKGGKGKVTELIGGGDGWCLGKNASPEAVKFVQFMVNQKNNARMAELGLIIPTVKGAESGLAAQPNMKLVKKLLDECTFFQLYPDQDLSPAAGGAVNDNVQAILAGTKTPAKACADIQKVYKDN